MEHLIPKNKAYIVYFVYLCNYTLYQMVKIMFKSEILFNVMVFFTTMYSNAIN